MTPDQQAARVDALIEVVVLITKEADGAEAEARLAESAVDKDPDGPHADTTRRWGERCLIKVSVLGTIARMVEALRVES